MNGDHEKQQLIGMILDKLFTQKHLESFTELTTALLHRNKCVIFSQFSGGVRHYCLATSSCDELLGDIYRLEVPYTCKVEHCHDSTTNRDLLISPIGGRGILIPLAEHEQWPGRSAEEVTTVTSPSKLKATRCTDRHRLVF
ncbi:hypothetical protein EVAR_82364_1 [Eumeta japonica]|uniref:Uncharacterized protein n=1 Tax=Eumeta variegata TaxID=151549 RepID=A0A4C1UA57_EUMVA|nr:hypothetical protein EVAR_82364_1 [Eumeta japonica]